MRMSVRGRAHTSDADTPTLVLGRRGACVVACRAVNALNGQPVVVGTLFALDKKGEVLCWSGSARDVDTDAVVQSNTGPTDSFPVKQMQLMRFDGTQWVVFGDIIG